MGRHSFIRQYKLSDVCGRIDYISNQDRQEYLYATYRTMGANDEFWENLSKENQQDFKASGTKGKCIEARELVIALPENYIEYRPYDVVKMFTEFFYTRYGVECCAALHHNKEKTNYHIHLIFSERKLLEKPQIKIATRNMFYNEQGKHVRTKKDIQDADGKIRVGCYIVPKGEVYESHRFTVKNNYFKSKIFIQEEKEQYTNLINRYVKNEAEKLSVFKPGSVYLATKKIGKNNPKEAEIREDNAARQEWNRTADLALGEGMQEEEILKLKKTEISEKISHSIQKHGSNPDMLRIILVSAIYLLTECVRKLTLPPKPKLEVDITEFRKMEILKGKLDKQTAVIRQAETIELPNLERKLKSITGFFKGKERKEAQRKIDVCKEKISNMKDELHRLVKESGYPNVQKFMDGYRVAYKLVAQYQQDLKIWKEKTGNSEPKPEQRRSIREKLRENERRVKEQEKARKRIPKRDRDVR